MKKNEEETFASMSILVLQFNGAHSNVEKSGFIAGILQAKRNLAILEMDTVSTGNVQSSGSVRISPLFCVETRFTSRIDRSKQRRLHFHRKKNLQYYEISTKSSKGSGKIGR
ncbi:hypothetical protein CKAN_01823200 [Cinnamomum micranthum f. kanehirae]|uniref:Uncharacterized protein n=1 Tax=Cinnamomum micranthum f. kanehirae TaxID=337451 RepID=A0A443PEI6_9MAGN|nr:hypothetical protein CKAN_01823200 [Cinnamomum micranthum f. kanehirae]